MENPYALGWEEGYKGYKREAQEEMVKQIDVKTKPDHVVEDTIIMACLILSDSDDCKEINQTLNKIKWE